jgi:predicted amidohydrolase YtcJ
LGVTSITEFVDFRETSRIYQDICKSGELNVRLQIVPCVHGLHKTADLDSIIDLGLTTGFGDEWIKFGGVKIFVDRGTETSLASIQLKEMVAKAHKAGLRVFMHANTRKAQDMALEAIETVVENMPGKDLRHRIEHMGNRLIDLKYFDRVKESGSIALPTAYFMNIGRDFPEGLKIFLYRTMLDKGLCVPGNSDSGGTEPEAPNPLYQIWCMVERKSRDGRVIYPDEKVSIMEGLRIYTMHSAFAGLEENIKGSIEPGKLADLIVLNKDPLTSPSDTLRDIEIDMTIVGGRIVYQK